MEKNRVTNQQLLQNRQQELDLMMLRFNGTHSPVQFSELEALFNDKRDWKALRLKLENLKEQQLLSRNHLERARQTLLNLQAGAERPEGEPEVLKLKLSEQLTETQHELNEVSAALSVTMSKLISHENCLLRAGKVEEELKKARENHNEWTRLCMLFGSADGKRFRTLAQSYTFAYLVQHANLHLRQLSPRYELCNIPGTLTLEIIDRNMFDEHRYVSSLSGGETFVVSLALALGLASMSGINLTIGSLFIDEGFGNLDKDSLDLVMMTLSNLENVQGRKVGVISHTTQIRSQISPQIRLTRLPGGSHSVIEVR